MSAESTGGNCLRLRRAMGFPAIKKILALIASISRDSRSNEGRDMPT